MNKLLLVIFPVVYLQCNTRDVKPTESAESKRIRQDSIVKIYVNDCAKTYNFKFQMPEWQNCLDAGLEMDSTIAYFWQQKAMPYFKAKKYEVGMDYIDKAVNYD